MGNDKVVGLVQGVYFFITGIWPILSIRSFMKVTGPKTDVWLVKTVGLVLAVIGAVLILAVERVEVGTAVAALAIGSAAGLASVDVIYVAKRVISPVYLLDAVAELALIAWWAVSLQ